jgi:hypothetical protein
MNPAPPVTRTRIRGGYPDAAANRSPAALPRRIRVMAALPVVVDDVARPGVRPQWVYGSLSRPREYPEWWGDAFLEGEGDPGRRRPGSAPGS